MGLIGAAIGLILFLVILGVIWYCIQQVLTLIPIAEPFRTLINIIIILVVAFIAVAVIIWLLGLIGVHVQMPLGAH